MSLKTYVISKKTKTSLLSHSYMTNVNKTPDFGYYTNYCYSLFSIWDKNFELKNIAVLI